MTQMLSVILEFKSQIVKPKYMELEVLMKYNQENTSPTHPYNDFADQSGEVIQIQH